MNPCPCCDLAVTPEEIAILRRPSFQARVHPWTLQCFGATIAADRLERCDRFIEEALELVQAGDYTADRAHALVDYVFGRPIGEPGQEVGGVRVTLAAFCNAFGIDEDGEAERELTRILAPEIIAKIRAKQAAKPHGSALPVAVVTTNSPSAAKLTAGNWWYPENETSEDDCCDSPYEVVERNAELKPGESVVVAMDRALQLPTVYAAVHAYTEEEMQARGDDEPWSLTLFATHEEAVRSLAQKER